MSEEHNEERFDPSRHDLAYAAKRLKEISEKNYQQRLDEVLSRHEEKDTNELATGGVIEHRPLLGRESGQEFVCHPLTLTAPIQRSADDPRTPPEIAGRHGTVRVAPLTEDRMRDIIAETIQRVLYPGSDGIVTHEQRRTRQWDADGTEWRGVLYKVEKEPPT